jgi:hypothetical protein
MPGDNGLHGNFNIKNTEKYWKGVQKKNHKQWGDIEG